MRPEPEFGSRSSSYAGRGREAARATAALPGSGLQQSTWHSPVPYLFGGLAAMLGLIALALLILACSYWKLSDYLDSDDAAGNGDDGQKPGDDRSNAQTRVFEEKVVVIMAGDSKPTYLATPIAGRAASSAPVSKANNDVEEKAPPASSTSLPTGSNQSGGGGSGCNRERSQSSRNKPQQ